MARAGPDRNYSNGIHLVLEPAVPRSQKLSQGQIEGVAYVNVNLKRVVEYRKKRKNKITSLSLVSHVLIFFCARKAKFFAVFSPKGLKMKQE